MKTTAQNTEVKGVGKRDDDEFVVGQNFGIEKLEDAMLGRLDGGDVAGEAEEHATHLLVGFAKNPPKFSTALAVVVIAFRFHVPHDVFVNERKARLHLVGA
jgi:hypothetical protein